MNSKQYRSIASGLLALGFAAVGTLASAQQVGPAPQGPSASNNGALTSCSSGAVLANCKPSNQVATTPVPKPDTHKKNSPGSYGDNGNHGNDGGPGSGAPGGGGVSDQ